MFRQMQQLWRNIKVRTKFIFILMLAMLLVLSGVLATFRMPYDAYDRQLYQSSAQVITLFAGQITKPVMKMRSVTTALQNGDYDVAIVVGWELMKTVDSKVGGDFLGRAAYYEKEGKASIFRFRNSLAVWQMQPLRNMDLTKSVI